jgi:hypothetical protein
MCLVGWQEGEATPTRGHGPFILTARQSRSTNLQLARIRNQWLGLVNIVGVNVNSVQDKIINGPR